MPDLIDIDVMARGGAGHAGSHRSVTDRYHFRRHGHRGCSEWTLVLGGELIQEIDGERRRYGAGDLIFIREATIHELWGHQLTFVNTPVRTTVHQSVADACGVTEWLQAANRSPVPPVRRLAGLALQQARACMQRACGRSQAATTVQLVSTLLELMTADGPPAALPEWLRAALVRIDAELERGLTVADLPALCDRSAAHIARTFRESLGCTPSTWLNRRRCERAADRLQVDPDCQLVDLALAVGFTSQSYFTRCFHQVFDTSPGRFRRQSGGI